MDISMLFQFPGILILIGVILLIIAIVIGIIAYRLEDEELEDVALENENSTNSSSDSIITKSINEINSEGEKVLQPNVINEENKNSLEDTIIIPKIISDSVSNTKVIAETNQKEITSIIDGNVTIEEPKVEESALSEAIFDETSDISIPTINEELNNAVTNDIDTIPSIEDSVNVKHEPNLDDTSELIKFAPPEIEIPKYESIYNPELEATRVVYGGIRPLENVDLDFDNTEHQAYSTKYVKPEDTLKYQAIPKKDTTFEDNIEVL